MYVTRFHQTAWVKEDNDKLYLVKHSDNIIRENGEDEKGVVVVQSPNHWKVKFGRFSFFTIYCSIFR